jgi:hypothetical protein
MSRINEHNYESFLLDYLEGNLDEASGAELKAFALANPQLGIELEGLELPYLAAEEITFEFKNGLLKTEEALEDEELLSYFENKLPPAEKQGFETKLAASKELQAALDQYRKTRLETDRAILIADKAGLYKNEDDFALNNRVLAYMEGQLTAADLKTFEAELKRDARLARELESYKKTKLEADYLVAYPNKQELKKEGRVILLFGLRWQAAAIAASLLLLLGLFAISLYNQDAGKGNVAGVKPARPSQTGETPVKNNSALAQSTKQPSRELASQPSRAVAKENAAAIQAQHSGQLTTAEPSVKRRHSQSALSNDPAGSLPARVPGETQLAANQPKVKSVGVQNNNPAAASPTLNNVVVKEGLASQNTSSKPDTVSGPLSENVEPVSTLADNEYRPVYNIPVEVDADEEESSGKKPGFWRRAVKTAQRANMLGIKSVEGEEEANQSFRLSFKAFSVEKK